jgi:diguanylate cyclase (GGDEF)-like protein
MIGKLAHVRSHGDVLLASSIITVISVVFATALTACATRASSNDVEFYAALRIAAAIAAAITFVFSFAVVETIRHILKSKRSVERLAMTDDLTGLANRRAFLAAAASALDGIGAGAPPALLIVDLDHFKNVNDVYGHRAGDQVLQAIARALERSVRAELDFVGRLGGEEFVVLLAGADEEMSRLAAESVRGAIAAMRVETPSGEVSVTASIGRTPLMRGDTISAALQRADEALYAAKRAGRNQVATRDPSFGDLPPPVAGDGRRRRDAQDRLRRSA